MTVLKKGRVATRLPAQDLERARAFYLAHRGEVFYEVAGQAEPSIEKPTCEPSARKGVESSEALSPIIPRAGRGHFGRRYIALPRPRIWHLKLPHSLGSPRAHRRMIDWLDQLSVTMPDFALQSADLGQSAGYDFTAHRKGADIAVERATRRWGTIPSLFRVEGTNEYFLFSRRLTFQKAQADLREHIIAELNGLLRRLRFDHRIVVSGLPTARDIEDTMLKFQRGEMSAEDAMAVGRL